MRLLFSLVCDEAEEDAQGKLDVRGVFHDLYAPGFPAVQERMVLVLVFEWGREDQGRFTFRTDLLDPSERPVLTVEGHSDVDRRPPDRPPARTRLVLPLEQVVFPEPGTYRFRVRAKGRSLDGPALHLVPADSA